MLPESSSTPAIRLRNVSKTFVITDDPAARLTALLSTWLRGHSKNVSAARKQFTAVQNVSLEIMRGECIGIIGRNGAGKSTLLQMIAGTLRPSTGEIATNGRVAALLELGSGFNPDFSGRENIYLNGAILGLSKDEVTAKYSAIVDYSGVAEFIDRPVRTYSSGMALRLAFAVCVHVDADILIIDEALAVGDARFQFKCHATLEQMIKDGRTIIFVSHDTNAVKRMCNTAILLERGEMILKGSPNDVTNLYTKLITSPHGLEAIRGDLEALKNPATSACAPAIAELVDVPAKEALAASALSRAEPDNASLVAEERAHTQISDKEYSYGGEKGRIESVTLHDDQDYPRLSFVAGSRARVRFRCMATETVPDPIYAVTLKDIRGQEIFGTNSFFQNLTPPIADAGSCIEVLFDLHLNILPGVYFLSAGWVRIENGEVQVIHRRYDAIRFDVLPRDRSFGIAYCPTQITVRAITSA